MANGNGMTTGELQTTLDQVPQLLQDAYQSESSREDLAAAVGDALDVLAGNGGDGDNDDDPDYHEARAISSDHAGLPNPSYR